jgi:hypothetical protein
LKKWIKGQHLFAKKTSPSKQKLQLHCIPIHIFVFAGAGSVEAGGVLLSFVEEPGREVNRSVGERIGELRVRKSRDKARGSRDVDRRCYAFHRLVCYDPVMRVGISRIDRDGSN